ncbi:hypothetical protein AX16_003637 [Volvariella volvacea WC 439]|nr:hypothetical protein AX16_003637 [Volvariella volvacea WC 439]
MHRLCRPSTLVPLRTAQPRRPFVSSLLLTRPWENKSVAELKQEARTRGLSVTGNKATLISRIQQFEESKQRESSSLDSPVSLVSRHASTSASASESSTPGEAPGIPPAHQAEALKNASSPSANYLNVAIPDIPPTETEAPVQVPYLPDFWDSATPKKAAVEDDLPKVLVVAGATTHHGGGPTFNLENVSESVEETSLNEASPKAGAQGGSGGLLDDVTEELGIPPLKELKNTYSKFFSS